ncbi:MAG: D-arabinono-1,4-lactone oxidase, partial [Bacteroidota bacterium]
MMKNWSGYLGWEPEQLFRPSREAEIVQIVQRAAEENKKIRLIGSGHSFTPLCPTDHFLISLDDYKGIVAVDSEQKQVTVRAGTKLNELSSLLDEHGLALENLGDIDVQSIAGAISTGTHGTGRDFGNLCTQIQKVKWINGLGEIQTCGRHQNPDLFAAVVLSLGALGILIEITIQCVPRYNLQLKVEKVAVDQLLADIDQYNAAHRHFEFYWFPNTPYAMTKAVNPSTDSADADTFKNYLQEVVLENYAMIAISELSTYFPSWSRKISRFAASTIDTYQKTKPSHKVFSTVRMVKFNEMEYNVPIEAYSAVKQEIIRWVNQNNTKIIFPLENRFVKGDNIMLSPAYQRDSAYIAVHVYHKIDSMAVKYSRKSF